MSENAGTHGQVTEQVGAMAGDRGAHLAVFAIYCAGLGEKCFEESAVWWVSQRLTQPAHSFEGPEQVHGSGTARGEIIADFVDAPS